MEEDEQDDRDSSVGLHFTVGVELRRRRGTFADRWEARFTSATIAVVAAVVVALVLVNIFGLLHTVFGQ